jgi:hypothetical protein
LAVSSPIERSIPIAKSANSVADEPAIEPERLLAALGSSSHEEHGDLLWSLRKGSSDALLDFDGTSVKFADVPAHSGVPGSLILRLPPSTTLRFTTVTFGLLHRLLCAASPLGLRLCPEVVGLLLRVSRGLRRGSDLRALIYRGPARRFRLV